MPNRDGTGPIGKGPKTGRGVGNWAQETGVNQDEMQENNSSSENCGRGRGLKPCRPYETSNTIENNNE